MKTIGKVVLILVLAPLFIPLGFIAIMLSPFLELFHKEDKDKWQQ